mgnify:CR=1 FL=1
MITVRKFELAEKHIAAAAFSIRSKVFVEEQHVSREEEFDEFENTSVHFIAIIDEQPCGAARWRKTEKGIKLERFAVLKSFRGNGVGEALLKAALNDVKGKNLKIYLHAQISAENFYKKYNFASVGQHFFEANIEHVVMEYTYPS